MQVYCQCHITSPFTAYKNYFYAWRLIRTSERTYSLTIGSTDSCFKPATRFLRLGCTVSMYLSYEPYLSAMTSHLAAARITYQLTATTCDLRIASHPVNRCSYFQLLVFTYRLWTSLAILLVSEEYFVLYSLELMPLYRLALCNSIVILSKIVVIFCTFCTIRTNITA